MNLVVQDALCYGVFVDNLHESSHVFILTHYCLRATAEETDIKSL